MNGYYLLIDKNCEKEKKTILVFKSCFLVKLKNKLKILHSQFTIFINYYIDTIILTLK